jgi:amidase
MAEPAHPAARFATLTHQLYQLAAGAVIVGKTNSCELGQWPFTSGPAFGHTHNPWSRRHTPGGLVTAAIGSDGAGGVRIPAAWIHLVGVKLAVERAGLAVDQRAGRLYLRRAADRPAGLPGQ